LSNGSSLNITRDALSESWSGVSGVNVTADASSINITNCKQGLVRCGLIMTGASAATLNGNLFGAVLFSDGLKDGQTWTSNIFSIGAGCKLYADKNFCGIYMYGGEVTVENGGTLEASSNDSRAIDVRGSTTVAESCSFTVKAGGSMTAEDNGIKWKQTDTDSKYNYKGTIDIFPNAGILTFENGANVSVSNNYICALRNADTAVIGSKTVMVRNGAVDSSVSGDVIRANYGGGIYNTGTLTLSSGAVVCNNHAAVAGDDIYNTGTMTLVPASGFNAVLDDCGHGITGWYYDGIKNGTNTARWNVSGCISGREEYIDEYSVLANDANTVALKATHGTIPVYVPVIVDPTPTPTPTPTPSETIPDENVPATDIPEPNTPKADASAQVTGDSGLIVWSAVTAAFSIAGLAYLSVSAKKRGE
jgi:hypothetical protein